MSSLTSWKVGWSYDCEGQAVVQDWGVVVERADWLQVQGRQVEMNPNVVLLVLLEVIDVAWVFTIAITIIEGEGEVWRKLKLTRCKRRESGPIEKESPGLSKGFLGIGPKPFAGQPNEGKARSGEGPRCSKDGGLFSLISEDQASMNGPKVRRQSCFASKVLKVMGEDGSKEAPPKNIGLYAPRSHHSPSRKLSSSRSVPQKEVARLSNLQGPIKEAKEALRPFVLRSRDGPDGAEVRDGSQHRRCLIQVQSSTPLSLAKGRFLEGAFKVSGPAQMEDFLIEGISPSKMASIKLVLVFMIIISWNTRVIDSIKKRWVVKDCLCLENPDAVLLQETKREFCHKRFVGSVWKVRNKQWAVLLASGALGGVEIFWDALKFKCLEVVLGSISVTVKLESEEEGSFWLSSIYGLGSSHFRKNFWLELQDLSGLTFPKWCVGGDFNVIRRISEKLGGSRWLANECRVEGWEDHKFMKNLQFVKSKLKEWNKVSFGELKEKKKIILLDIVVLDEKEQEGNFLSHLAARKTLRKRELEDVSLKEEVFWRQKSRAIWINEGDSKALSRRLRKVLQDTIISTQGAFVEGRQILDVVVIANELVDEKRRSREEGVAFKIDF
ncbi:hypothetical protein CK203_035391 [Vitis vinifera]|uniref:DUF4283 domain-containing protein n=1 Tax=Vitis vinifera TaxID=29760 RepID=A0A438I3R7_VITVI|nr:hypothetical protein CK203_035391 [Vitis vinifera]